MSAAPFIKTLSPVDHAGAQGAQKEILDIALKLNYIEAERMWRSEDTIEGPRAFAQKRKPSWKGR